MNIWPCLITLGLLALSLQQYAAASQCGVRSGMPKIVGGSDVTSLKFPWYVALVVPDSSSEVLTVSCGGSLITSKHVLSAAHCFPKDSGIRLENMYEAVLGLTNRCEPSNPQTSRIVKVQIYPTFNTQTLEGDVAVATLERSVTFTPVCLPPKGSVVTGEASIIGFGSTKVKSASQYPCVLQEAFVNIMTHRQCVNTGLETKFTRLPGTYCAGVLRGGTDSCDGDSGGPLQTKSSSGVYTIQGIVSFGEGCGRRNLPGVYTQVSYYRDFIDRAISDSGVNYGTTVGSGETSVSGSSSNYPSSSSSSSFFDFPYSFSLPSIFDTLSSSSSSSSSFPFSSFLDSWNPWGSRSVSNNSHHVSNSNFSNRPNSTRPQTPTSSHHSSSSYSPPYFSFSSFLPSFNSWSSQQSVHNISAHVNTSSFGYRPIPLPSLRPSPPPPHHSLTSSFPSSSSFPFSSLLDSWNTWGSQPVPNVSLIVNSSSLSSGRHPLPLFRPPQPQPLHSAFHIFNRRPALSWNFTFPWASRIKRSATSSSSVLPHYDNISRPHTKIHSDQNNSRSAAS